MALPIAAPYEPMEARQVDAIPDGDQWQYEPKWDGFRCLAFRDGDEVQLQSKSGQALERYFPEIVEAAKSIGARHFVLDGEIVIPAGQGLSFDALLARIHPAASRVRKLAAETPAVYQVFDLLADERGRALVEQPLADRRTALDAFAKRYFERAGGRMRLSPFTRDIAAARDWLSAAGGALDGVIAKRRDLPYRSGERDGMQKIKRRHTADCVIGGFRYAANGHEVGSLLLGLYDKQGRLDHVGFTSSLPAAVRADMTRRLVALREPPGFTGRAPGGPSRWSRGRDTSWEPVRPEIVVEVLYDHVTSARFRHGTRLVRLRPEKAPRQCTLDQIE